MMKSLVFAFSLLLPLFVSAKTEILFDREIQVSDRTRLTWADLVRVEGGNDEIAAEMASIPYAGGGASEIRAQFRDRRVLSDVYEKYGVKIVIPQSVDVQKVKGYSSSEFRRKLGNRLSAQCGECRFDIRAVNDGKVSLGSDWNMDESAVRPIGSLLVPVSSSSMGTAWVPVQLRVTRNVPVLRRSVIIGQRVGADDVEMKEADVSHLKDAPVSLEDLREAVAMRTLPAGQVLTLGDLKKQDLVKRGQTVKLVSENDAFEITVNAVAEENGRRGDRIKVKTSDSGRVLTAEVMEEGKVRLQ